MQDLTQKQNKVLLDLGGKTILENLLDGFDAANIGPCFVTAGFDGLSIKRRYAKRASILLNPFFEEYGVLSSVWIARPEIYASAALLSVGDHYIEPDAILDFKKSQPDADILVHVEMKKCDDEDMKVFIDAKHQLHTISKVWGKSAYTVLGEFTGMIRFSPAGSRLFFDTLAEMGWQRPLSHETFLADLLMACHRVQPLAFFLSNDHRRMDVDYPSDYARARELFASRPKSAEPEAAETTESEEPAGIRFESSWHTA